MRAKFICESINDLLKPKTKEEILKNLNPIHKDVEFKQNHKVHGIGTDFIGYLNISYSKLVKLFGKPYMFDDPYNITMEWMLDSNYRDVVTIYDYKATNFYYKDFLTIQQLKKLNSFKWHIGGYNKEVLNDFLYFVYKNIM